jgi:hypothetical protein
VPSDTANPATVMVAAESIDLSPTTSWQDADAAVRAARNAHDKDDLVLLLDALGLPRGEDEIVRLLPFLATTRPGTVPGLDTPRGGIPVPDTDIVTASPTVEQADVLSNLDPMTREVALSMRARGDSPLKILAATGLDESDLQRLNAQHPDAAEAARAAEQKSPYGSAADELLAWGEQHAQAKVQRLAEQARQSLGKLLAQREADQAVAAYETKLANLKAQLLRAEQALRDAKAGKPIAAPARTTGSAGTELAQPADRATRDAIRAWGAEHGHSVADRGVIPQSVLRAWFATHPETLAQAS